MWYAQKLQGKDQNNYCWTCNIISSGLPVWGPGVAQFLALLKWHRDFALLSFIKYLPLMDFLEIVCWELPYSP